MVPPAELLPAGRRPRKIDLPTALAMLQHGDSKATVARHFGVSRSAVSQALKPQRTAGVPYPGKAVEVFLARLDQTDADLARALRRHARLEADPTLIRVIVLANADARKALETLPRRRADLAVLWHRPVAVLWD